MSLRTNPFEFSRWSMLEILSLSIIIFIRRQWYRKYWMRFPLSDKLALFNIIIARYIYFYEDNSGVGVEGCVYLARSNWKKLNKLCINGDIWKKNYSNLITMLRVMSKGDWPTLSPFDWLLFCLNSTDFRKNRSIYFRQYSKISKNITSNMWKRMIYILLC